MQNIDQRIDLWKNKLLDLSKRNRLLNFKVTKRSVLMISKPTIFDLWEQFVVDEKSIEFPFCDDESITQSEEKDFVENDESIVTNQTRIDMQKTLRNLRARARTAMEEQGINILYLSFGFLKWQEKDDIDFFLAPIVLVPVKLKIASVNSPFTMELHEDEIIVNPTLMYKLSLEFNIELPEFNLEDDLSAYLKEIETAISQTKWKVSFEAGLSLLSFLKINMYKDLQLNRERIKNNKVVCALSGDNDVLEKAPEWINDFDYDANVKPTDQFQVVDADSSQQKAIIMAKQGISFVLQGPPGTGKSQTITNIIAECLAVGKKVLFVAEKMAALEVVHNRLEETNLEDFCLILHSHKANKKKVMEQLSSMLDLSNHRANLSDQVNQKLCELQGKKEKLNDYAKQLYEVVIPLEKNIYQVNGSLANLDQHENIIFDIPEAETVTPQKLYNITSILSQYSTTTGKKSGDMSNNPWHGSSVQILTNDLRHNIDSRLPGLVEKIEAVIAIIKIIETELGPINNTTYENLRPLQLMLELSALSAKAQPHWISVGDLSSVKMMAEKYYGQKREFYQSIDELAQIYSSFRMIGGNIRFSEPVLTSTLVQLNECLENVQIALDQDYCFRTWQNIEQGELSLLCNDLCNHLESINESRTELSSSFDPSVFSIDYKQLLVRFRTEYNSIFRIFNSKYKADRQIFQELRKDESSKTSDKDIIKALISLQRINSENQWLSENKLIITKMFGAHFIGDKTSPDNLRRLLDQYLCLIKIRSILKSLKETKLDYESKNGDLKCQFGRLYYGMETDWDKVQESLNWAEKIREYNKIFNLSTKYIETICTDDIKIKLAFEIKTDLAKAINEIDSGFAWYAGLFENPDKIRQITIPELCSKIKKGIDNLYLLEEWIDYKKAKAVCIKEGLQECIENMEKKGIDAQKVVPAYLKRFYRLWLDKILPHYPAVNEFRRSNHENMIKEFVDLDILQFNIAKARIQKRLMDSLPSLDRITSGVDEVNVLKRELAKQRRIMPLRKLFREIPNLLVTLKPCLMMSPLSVSLFLESQNYLFDTVIFDEASQICTENAIGAISRGKQVILVGDNKQLPPTSFFNSTGDEPEFDYDYDDDDLEYPDDYESILDEAEASSMQKCPLLWHYRSRNEGLIAFPNREIYNNSLYTFPSNTENTAGNGIEFVYVDNGYYDRGGKKGNIVEAEKVAEMVFEHFRLYPTRSLGVIAFGEVQQQAIDSTIRKKRKQDQSLEHFFNEEIIEPFFVKNIENVQGDERDTIILSIGYGKDVAGKMSMNFGPLNKKGGQRRLNVAITRAKYNLKVVGSILSSDIDATQTENEGPKLLKAYIEYASNKDKTVSTNSIKKEWSNDTPFEDAICDFVKKNGYQYCTQLGSSKHKIDIVVRHPVFPDKYVIGIVCDGQTYHNAKTARERDRLFQQVLEGLGWKIYRVWSTDWIKDPKTEGQKLLEAIRTAQNSNPCSNNNPESQLPNNNDFIDLEHKDVSIEKTIEQFGFQRQLPTSFSDLPRNAYGYLSLSDCIKAIVDNEFPIHYELICKKVAPLMGNDKATVRIRREVDYALRSVRGVLRKGDFFFTEGYTKIIPKTIDNTRPIQHICPEELAEVMYVFISNSFGMTRESLMQMVSREYGFSRIGDRMMESMTTALNFLVESDRAKEIDGKIIKIL